MSAPLPKDPLDEPIARFVAAVKHFLDKEKVEVESPKQVRIQNVLDVMLVWEELKRHLGRVHQALVGAEPEAKERLQTIVSLGSVVIGLTDDPHIVGPVEDLVRMASEEQAEIGNFIERLGKATSLPAVLQLLSEATGFGSRGVARRNEIATTLDALTAYYLLQMPPRDSA